MTTRLLPSEIATLVCLGFVPPDKRVSVPPSIPRITFGERPSRLATSEANLPPAFIVASAILALGDEGSIELSYVEKKRWDLLAQSHVTVIKTSQSSYSADSIEGQLSRQLPDASRADPNESIEQRFAEKRLERKPYVLTLAEGWFRSLSGSYPAAALIRRVEARLIAGGWLISQEEQTGGLIGRGKAKETVRPNLDAIPQAVPEIRDWVERLTGGTRASELRPPVLEDVHRALNKATSGNVPWWTVADP